MHAPACTILITCTTLVQAKRAKADTPCKWMWEDAVYQWRVSEKRHCLFALIDELRKRGQVLGHSEYDKEWALWSVVALGAIRWLVATRKRLNPESHAALKLEYNDYYKGAPYDQDASDPSSKVRDKDHRSARQQFRKSRYASDASLKKEYRCHFILTSDYAYSYEPVTDAEGWVSHVQKVAAV